MGEQLLNNDAMDGANGICIPRQGRWIVVSIPSRHIYVAKDGQVSRTLTEFSTGRPGFLTPLGTFEIDPYRRYKVHRSSEFHSSGAHQELMPFALFFYQGAAFYEGDPHLPSHGGIHLNLPDAKWLFEWASDYSVGVRVQGPAITIHE
jgi:hypothetical protein